MNAAEAAPIKVLGRYALHEAIASGGMATVHYGRLLGPVGFARTVAIKRLHERLAQDPEFTAMFLDEARLAARIRHPNVVPTLDIVAMENELFLVMEYVQGESLARLYARYREQRSRIDVRVVTTILASALHGLHAAHEATSESGEPLGVIHRDVSPQNIMVGVDGVPRVLDFGVAKAAGRASTTRDGQLKGKLSYMAPEQLRGKPPTRAIDVYAAGVVLWEGLVGRKLYRGDSEAELVTLVLEAKADPPSHHAPGIPAELDAIVLKALDRDPSRRWATAREMARALERLIPPVPASEIGEWVEHTAGNTLAARSQTISLIERSAPSNVTAVAGSQHTSAPGIPAQPVAPPPMSSPSAASQPSSPSLPSFQGGPEASMTNGSAIEIPVHGPRGKRLWVALAIAGAVLFLVVAGTFVSLGSRLTARRAPAAPSETGAPTPPAEPTDLPAADPPPAVAAAPDPSESAARPKDETAPAERPPEPARAQPVKSGAAATERRPAAAAKPSSRPHAPSCDPPYVIDANGTRRYKRECAR